MPQNGSASNGIRPTKHHTGILHYHSYSLTTSSVVSLLDILQTDLQWNLWSATTELDDQCTHHVRAIKIFGMDSLFSYTTVMSDHLPRVTCFFSLEYMNGHFKTLESVNPSQKGVGLEGPKHVELWNKNFMSHESVKYSTLNGVNQYQEDITLLRYYQMLNCVNINGHGHWIPIRVQDTHFIFVHFGGLTLRISRSVFFAYLLWLCLFIHHDHTAGKQGKSLCIH